MCDCVVVIGLNSETTEGGIARPLQVKVTGGAALEGSEGSSSDTGQHTENSEDKDHQSLRVTPAGCTVLQGLSF